MRVASALAGAAVLACLCGPVAAQTPAPSRHCVNDLLTDAQRVLIGEAALTGENTDKASAAMEGATATCATRLTPVEVNAAVAYANDASALAAAQAQLKSLGAEGLIDKVWSQEAADRKDVIQSVKAGEPPAAVVARITALAPKGDDAQPAALAALMGLTAKASMAIADAP